jgi:hypothetical protein
MQFQTELLPSAPEVGSRTGAALRRFGLSAAPRFLCECLRRKSWQL